MPPPAFVPSIPLAGMHPNLAPQQRNVMRVFVCRSDRPNYSKCAILDPRRTPTFAEFRELVARKLQVEVHEAAELRLDGMHLVESLDEIRDGDKLALNIVKEQHCPNSVTDGSASQIETSSPFASMEISVPQTPKRGTPKKDARKPKASSSKTAPRNRGASEVAGLLEVWESSFAGPYSRATKSTTPKLSPRSLPAALKPRQAKVNAQLSLKETDLAKNAVANAVAEVVDKSTKKRGNTDITSYASSSSSSGQKLPAKKVKQEADPFPVGKKLFYNDEEHEYPITIIPPQESDKLKENQRRVHWIGYPHLDEIVDVDGFVPWTKERESHWNNVTVPLLKKKDKKDKQADLQHKLFLSSPPTANNNDTSTGQVATNARQDQPEGNFAPMVFEVGGKYYLKHQTDGHEYPVQIVRFCTKTDTDKYVVSFIGYSKGDRTVTAKDLLPVTPNREKIHQAKLAFTKQQRTMEKKQRSIQQSKKKKTQLTKQEKEKEKRKQKRKEEERRKLQEKELQDRLWGPATDVTNLPTRDDDESKLPQGTCWEHQNRRIYFALDNERPIEIAQKFQLPIEKLLYDNCQVHGQKLAARSCRLIRSTPIVLPLEWNSKEIKLDSSTPGPSKNRNDIDNEEDEVDPIAGGDLDNKEGQSVVAGLDHEGSGLTIDLSSDLDNQKGQSVAAGLEHEGSGLTVDLSSDLDNQEEQSVVARLEHEGSGLTVDLSSDDSTVTENERS